MCDRMTMLARLDHRRWIGCCEHGTTYLTWDGVSMRLPLQRLAAMSRTLHECAQVARYFRIAGTADVCVVFDQYDLYQLWFGGVGFCLSPNDFMLFCRLTGEAGRHSLALSNADEPVISSPASSIRTPYHLFSVN